MNVIVKDGVCMIVVVLMVVVSVKVSEVVNWLVVIVVVMWWPGVSVRVVLGVDVIPYKLLLIKKSFSTEKKKKQKRTYLGSRC